jgi:hypothetical protein
LTADERAPTTQFGQALKQKIEVKPLMRVALLVCLSVVLFAVVSLLFPAPVLAGVGVSPSTISFGSVTINSTSSAATVTISNGGRQGVSILQISSSLPQFAVLAPALPVALGAHSSVSFQVVFSPTSAVSYSGTIVVQTNSPGGNNRAVSVSGTGISTAATTSPTYLLSANTSNLNFGSILVGTATSLPFSLINTGTGSVTISQVSLSGNAYAVSGFPGSVTLAAGQSLSLSVSFTPPVAGSASGSLSVVSNATNSPIGITLSGTGVQPQISVTPASVNFGSISTGVTNTQTLTISNPGTANLTLSQAVETGSGFSLSGLAMPLTIAPGGSYAFSVSFNPASAGTFSGTLTLSNNSPTPSLSVPLSGSGVAPTLTLAVSPASLSFGNVTTGTSASQTVSLTNTGNSNVTLSQDSISGAGFNVSGLSFPLTLSPGQATSFSVVFAPAATGSITGSVVVSSNASNSPTTVSLTGTGASPIQHTVSVSWTPSSTTYAGFNLYRGTTSGGPYTKLDSSLLASSSFSDGSVSSGQTYYYVATEVDSNGVESAYSNESAAAIP